MSDAKIVAIYTYPVKGLSPQPHDGGVDMIPGEHLPFDRAYAIENGPGAFDPAAPRHLPKVTFLCLMRNEGLANLQTVFSPRDKQHRLTIFDRHRARQADGDLATSEGRAQIETFFADAFASDLRGRPRVVSAPDHSFSDVREKCLHVVNLASVRALETVTGRVIDPLRFRPNLIIDGLPTYSELELVGREIAVGSARLVVFKRTVRCAATDVDPASGRRGGDLPGAIETTLGHRDFGIYAQVTTGGRIGIGDRFHIA